MPENETPIAELMARDPLKLSNVDLDRIIAELRKQRSHFVLSDDKKIGTPSSRKSAAQVKKEKARELLENKDISDLLGDL